MCGRLVSCEAILGAKHLATLGISAHVCLHGIVHLLVLHEVILAHKTLPTTYPQAVEASTRVNVFVRLKCTKLFIYSSL